MTRHGETRQSIDSVNDAAPHIYGTLFAHIGIGIGLCFIVICVMSVVHAWWSK